MQAYMAERGGLRQAGQMFRMAMTALMAATLAACATVVPRTEAPTAPPTTTGPVVTPGLPTDTERHRVALLVPQTGPDAAVGTSIANAVTLALLDSRSDRVRITTYDTGAGAAAAAQQAIADGNKLILGPLLADDVRAVQPVARAANVPLISFSNDSSVAGNGTYLLGFEPGQSVTRVVAYARAQGQTRFGALVPRSTYGDRALASLRAAVQAAGGTLVASEAYDRSATALSGAARRLGNAGAMDAILIADAGQTAIRVVPVLRQSGQTNSRILGTELWNTEAALSGSAPMRGAWFASVSDTLFGQMATRYRERYGRTPYRLASLGYDAVLLTVRMTRDWRPGTNFPQNRLLASDGFGGIDGIFRFDSRGIAQRALEVSEVRAGGFTVIDAAPTQW
jgi:ABC-type branched-subunit amino acid transport system substrate-binding protein